MTGYAALFTKPRGRTGLRVLGLMILLGSVASCGSLNPSFLGSVGVSPIASLEDPPGSVLAVLINRTAFRVELQADVDELDGSSGREDLETGGNSFFITARDCEISQITFTEITVTVLNDQGGTTEETVDLENNILLGGTNFQCGSVVAVIVDGAAGDFEATIQVF